MLRKPDTLVSIFISALATVVLAFAPAAHAQWNEEVLYSFQSIPDGAGPIGRIVYDKDGNLYGATLNGGAANCYGPGQCGTVYELSPPAKNGDPWIETILHVFQGLQAGDGATPGGGLIMDAAGNLYGTTEYDGTGQCRLSGAVIGCGTAYEMSPPSQPGGAWTETVIYNFQGGKDGYVPSGDLVFDQSGNLYGVTLWGGGRGTTCDALYGGNCGTVFELSPPKEKGGAWTEQVLYSFAGAEPWSVVGDGGQPNGGLVFDAKGNIYGTTPYGGTTAGPLCRGAYNGCGTVFELVRPTEPYGTWAERILHFFAGQPSDGGRPNGNLAMGDKALYGTTFSGGSDGSGVVFELRALEKGNDSWAESLIYDFSGSDEEGPWALLEGPNGSFLGTVGGGPYNAGLTYKLKPPSQKGQAWDLIPEYYFTGPPNGYNPEVLSLLSGPEEMYGSTFDGGAGQACNGGCGTVFGIKP